jgi:hypothetical protein
MQRRNEMHTNSSLENPRQYEHFLTWMLIERANYTLFNARCTASSSAENLGLVRSDTVSRIFHHPLTYHHNPKDINLQQEN